MRWKKQQLLSYLSVGAACLALAVVASADPTTGGPPTHADMVRRWHLASPAMPTMGTRPPLVFDMINTGDNAHTAGTGTGWFVIKSPPLRSMLAMLLTARACASGW